MLWKSELQVNKSEFVGDEADNSKIFVFVLFVYSRSLRVALSLSLAFLFSHPLLRSLLVTSYVEPNIYIFCCDGIGALPKVSRSLVGVHSD